MSEWVWSFGTVCARVCLVWARYTGYPRQLALLSDWLLLLLLATLSCHPSGVTQRTRGGVAPNSITSSGDGVTNVWRRKG